MNPQSETEYAGLNRGFESGLSKSPTQLTSSFLKRINEDILIEDEKITQKSLKSLISKINLHKQYLSYFQTIREYLEKPLDFQISELNKRSLLKIWTEWGFLSQHISKNTLLLSYAYLHESSKRNPVKTKEDYKLELLSDIANDKSQSSKFFLVYGHHAIDGYEIREKRFKEYSDDEIFNLSKPLKKFRPVKHQTIEEYLKKREKDKYPIYSYLREELRDRAMLIITELRELMIQSSYSMDNMVKKNYEELYGSLTD